MPYSPVQFWILTIGFVALPLVAALAVWRGRGQLLLGMSAIDKRWVPAVALAALAVRLLLPEPAVFHQNAHGYRYIAMAIDPMRDLHVYGSGFQAFFHLFYTWLPLHTKVVIVGNIFLGSLTVLFMGWAGARLFGTGAGVATALLLAFNPAHIRLSATEDPIILALAMGAIGLWAALELRRRASWELAIGCAITVASAAQVRPLLMVIPVFVAVLALFHEPGVSALARRATIWCAALATALLLVPHLMWMANLHLGDTSGHYGGLLNLEPAAVLTGAKAFLFDSARTPPALWVLTVLGLVLGMRSRWRPTLLIALSCVAAVWLFAGRQHVYAEALRFAVPPQVLLTLVAGPGLAATARWLGRDRPFLVASLATLAAATGLLSSEPIEQATSDTLEYAFLGDTWEYLPAGCGVLLPPWRMSQGRINAGFPSDDYRTHHPGLSVIHGSDPAHQTLFTDYDCVLYYRGLACSSFHLRDEELASLRPECAELERGFDLQPVAVGVIETSSLPPNLFAYPEPAIRVGFYSVIRADASR